MVTGYDDSANDAPKNDMSPVQNGRSTPGLRANSGQRQGQRQVNVTQTSDVDRDIDQQDSILEPMTDHHDSILEPMTVQHDSISEPGYFYVASIRRR